MSTGLPAALIAKRTGIGLQNGAKSLLRNTIRHTDTHNRLLEEAEMWQIHYRMKGESSTAEDDAKMSREKRKSSPVKVTEPQIENSFLYDKRRDVASHRSREHRKFMRRAHMDDEEGDSDGEAGQIGRAVSQSTFWQRQLLKAEEEDGDRWGHGGFKELYPQDFKSDRSESEEKSEDKTRDRSRKNKKLWKSQSVRKKKKKRKSRQDSDTEQRKKKKKKKKKKTNRGGSDENDVNRKRKRTESMSSDDRDSDDRVKKKRKRQKDKTKHSELDGSENSSSKRKRKWRRGRNDEDTDTETSDSSLSTGSFDSGTDSDTADPGWSRGGSKHRKLASKPSSASESECWSPPRLSGEEDDDVKEDFLLRHRHKRKGKRKIRQADSDTDHLDGEKRLSYYGEPAHRKKKRRK